MRRSLSLITQVVDVDGNDIYLPHIERLKIPISFIQGARNTLFYPENTQKTFRHLCEKNGPDNYIHIQFPNYGRVLNLLEVGLVEPLNPSRPLDDLALAVGLPLPPSLRRSAVPSPRRRPRYLHRLK